MHRTTISALLLAVSLALNDLMSVDSFVQDSLQQAVPRIAAADNAKLTLADGMPVRLRFVRAVVSSQVIAGEKVPLEVVEPVLAGSLVAIPERTAVEAIVTMAQAKRSMGRGGNLELKIEDVRLADGELVPVRASKDPKSGGPKVATTAGTGAPRVVYWLASTLIFDVKGKNATIPAGTEITTYIAGDFPLDPSKFQTIGTTPQEKNAPK